jgi:hypothetical protein
MPLLLAHRQSIAMHRRLLSSQPAVPRVHRTATATVNAGRCAALTTHAPIQLQLVRVLLSTLLQPDMPDDVSRPTSCDRRCADSEISSYAPGCLCIPALCSFLRALFRPMASFTQQKWWTPDTVAVVTGSECAARTLQPAELLSVEPHVNTTNVGTRTLAANKGIGKAIVQLLAGQQLTVVATARNGKFLCRSVQSCVISITLRECSSTTLRVHTWEASSHPALQSKLARKPSLRLHRRWVSTPGTAAYPEYARAPCACTSCSQHM